MNTILMDLLQKCKLGSNSRSTESVSCFRPEWPLRLSTTLCSADVSTRQSRTTYSRCCQLRDPLCKPVVGGNQAAMMLNPRPVARWEAVVASPVAQTPLTGRS